jgi:hypothetical protein
MSKTIHPQIDLPYRLKAAEKTLNHKGTKNTKKNGTPSRQERQENPILLSLRRAERGSNLLFWRAPTQEDMQKNALVKAASAKQPSFGG